MRAASLLVPPRQDKPELLDLGQGTPADVRASFADLWRINRYLGGVLALTRHLYPRLRSCTRTVTIADVGTGSAEIAALVARWAARQRLHVHIVAIDFAARNLNLARSFVKALPNVQLVQADARSLPLALESVDYVISSLFLHHFNPDQVVRLLREFYARARRGIIMSDGERGWLPYIGFRLVQPVFARSYLTRHDGAASVRRAYTPDELRQMAQAAGLQNAHVHRHPLWRMTLVADK
jgi:ubiquinone/menaquinone biosynthesis C-methylase UbiE